MNKTCPNCKKEVDHLMFDQYRCEHCEELWTIRVFDGEQYSFITPRFPQINPDPRSKTK